MPGDAAAELRMLRTKAYGPGGGLSPLELERLHELEGWDRRPDAEQSADPAAESAVEPDTTDDFLQEFAPPETAEESSSVADVPTTRRSRRSRVPRRWRGVAAAVALLAVGLGVGWGIWGWDRDAAALAAAHGQTQAELEASDRYDRGTVTPVLEQYGVVIWDAQRADGTERCVIITSPKLTSPQSGCVTTEQMADSAWPNANATVPDGEEKAGQQLSAALLLLPSGEVAPYVQVWGLDSGWESQFDENELAQLRSLEAAGHGRSMLNILGHDGDHVIWWTQETGMLCVIAGSGDGFAEACADDFESPVSLALDVDGIQTNYVVTQSDRRGPQLTIFKDVDAEYYFGSAEESSIDDKTGK